MLKRAFDAGVPAAWVTGEERLGGESATEDVVRGTEEYAYVLAVSGKKGRMSQRCGSSPRLRPVSEPDNKSLRIAH